MTNSQRVLNSPFNINTHKETFVNYLEVIINEDGTISYAVPSHQEKLIAIACKKLNVTRNQLNDLCPPEFYFDFMFWLCKVSKCVAVWNEGTVGIPNDRQRKALETLKEEGLYLGTIQQEKS